MPAEPDDPVLTPGEPSRWMVVPVVAGVLVLLILGLVPPTDLVSLLNDAAADLAVGVR